MKPIQFLFIAAISLSSVITNAQQKVNIKTEISTNSVLLGNYFEVTFIIEDADIKEFDPPSFESFDIISGPNQSTSMTIINGEISRSISYSFFLAPHDIGNYFIQPAYANTDKGMLESAPIALSVLDNPDGIIQSPKQDKNHNLFQHDDFFGRSDFFRNFFEENMDPFAPDNPAFKNLKKTPKKKKKPKIYRL